MQENLPVNSPFGIRKMKPDYSNLINDIKSGSALDAFEAAKKYLMKNFPKKISNFWQRSPYKAKMYIVEKQRFMHSLGWEITMKFGDINKHFGFKSKP